MQIPLILRMISELSRKNPDYTFGQLMYTIMREKYIGVEIKKIGTLRDIPDNNFITSVEKSIQNENK